MGTKKIFGLVAVMVAVCFAACAGSGRLPSQYDTYEGCLICDIAKEKGVRLEDVGAGIRLAGAAARAVDAYTKHQAIMALQDVRIILGAPITGEGFVSEILDLSDKYAEVLTIGIAYARMFSIDKYLDDQSTEIITNFLDGHIDYLKNISADEFKKEYAPG